MRRITSNRRSDAEPGHRWSAKTVGNRDETDLRSAPIRVEGGIRARMKMEGGRRRTSQRHHAMPNSLRQSTSKPPLTAARTTTPARSAADRCDELLINFGTPRFSANAGFHHSMDNPAPLSFPPGKPDAGGVKRNHFALPATLPGGTPD